MIPLIHGDMLYLTILLNGNNIDWHFDGLLVNHLLRKTCTLKLMTSTIYDIFLYTVNVAICFSVSNCLYLVKSFFYRFSTWKFEKVIRWVWTDPFLSVITMGARHVFTYVRGKTVAESEGILTYTYHKSDDHSLLSRPWCDTGFPNFRRHFFFTRMCYGYFFRLWICFVFFIFLPKYRKCDRARGVCFRAVIYHRQDDDWVHERKFDCKRRHMLIRVSWHVLLSD